MRITIVCVGKLKEKYWQDAIAEYSKRLSRYHKLEIVELPDEKAPETMSPAQEEEVKKKEGERILKAIKDDAFAVTSSASNHSFSKVHSIPGNVRKVLSPSDSTMHKQ